MKQITILPVVQTAVMQKQIFVESGNNKNVITK